MATTDYDAQERADLKALREAQAREKEVGLIRLRMLAAEMLQRASESKR